MKSEIGSNFWEYDTNEMREYRFWWESSNYYRLFFKDGRNAFLAVSTLLASRYHRVIFPSYHCETETEPWYVQGWHVGYYPVESDFSIRAERLEEALERFQPEVICIQGYYGFNCFSDACVEVLTRWKTRGAIVIEDITHSIFSGIHFGAADYYVASLRKFFAIPDGGVLISSNRFPPVAIRPYDPEITRVALQAYRLKNAYFQGMSSDIKARFRAEYVRLNNLISINDALYEMSESSVVIFNSINPCKIKEKRRQNYQRLYDELQTSSVLSLPLGLVDPCTVPLYLPAVLHSEKDRNSLREFLAKQHDIYCPVLWVRPWRMGIMDEETEKIYQCILCIPIDQRYDADDMNRIAAAVNEWSHMQ